MAVLKEQASNTSNLFWPELQNAPVPPAGAFPAKIIDVKDIFGAIVPKFQCPGETEKKDITAFLFGFRDANGNPHKIATRSMTISMSEKSTLMKVLQQITGTVPKAGWDYCEVKGRDVYIQIMHEPKRDGSGVFPKIVSIMPLATGTAPQPVSAPAVQQPALPTAVAQPPSPVAPVTPSLSECPF